MRVLYVTFESPSRFYGGGRALIQSLESLSGFCEIDYVGLPFDIEEFPQFNIKNCYFLKKKKNPISGAINILRGVPTFSFSSWQKIKKKIDCSLYDFAFIEFSHIDFVVKWAQKHSLKTVLRVHNVEYDIVKCISKFRKLDKNKIRAIINQKKIFKREKESFLLADRVIFLTKNDLNRACDLYGDVTEKSEIIPICMHAQLDQHYEKVFDFDYILTTGSLNYGANVEGISWLISNAWELLEKREETKNIKLIVAGSNPTKEIKELCSRTSNCVLVDTPPSLGPYLEHALFYVAPIFVGAGMKVKIAEALSFGLRVVGTDHAFIGYEKAEKFLFRANSANEFADKIVSLLLEEERSENRLMGRELFQNEYSMMKSNDAYKQVINGLFS